MIKRNKGLTKSICAVLVTAIVAGTIVPNEIAFGSDNYFNENFENGYSNWEFQKGNWSVATDTTKVLSYTTTSAEGRALRGNLSWTNYSVSADIKVTNFNGSNKAYLCGRYTDGNNFYGVALSSKNGGLVELRKKIDGSSTVIAKADVSIEANTCYNVKLTMDGSNIQVYIDGQLVLESTDSSISSGAVGLVASKVAVNYDNIVVSSLDSSVEEDTSKDEDITEDEDTTVGDDTTVVPGDSNVEDTTTPDDSVVEDTTTGTEGTVTLSDYSVEGFAAGVTGGGILDESSEYYVQVTNATELAAALKKKSKVKVIEIMNDINLGWYEIESSAQTAPITQNITALTHPILLESGVSKVTVDSFDGLTIYSKNGATLKHAGFTFKNCKNVVIRNVEFSELWEWDENTKGNYDRNDWDYITLEGCAGVWIDHCTFSKAYDGVVDSKKGTTGLTISWSKFLPGDLNDSFYTAMFDAMESNQSEYPMYEYLRGLGLSQEDIMKVASPQKKTHLIGASEFASDNADLEVTLHHNYYKDSQDRMPRLRGGDAHIYNIVIDATDAYEYSSILTSSIKKSISSTDYHFGLTSNGALSTEGGALLMEKSVILGVKSPLKNNQKSASKSEYTGKIVALDTIYEYGSTSFRGNSTDENSPLSPEPATAIEFSWNKYDILPYEYHMDEPETLMETLTGTEGAGANVLDLTTVDWLTTTY